ncbi:MAG: site-specific integrase [Bdellovibrionia bacterium]
MTTAPKPRLTWTEKNVDQLEKFRRKNLSRRLDTQIGSVPIRRTSVYDPKNHDHLLLDSIMPKEEASEVTYLNFERIHQAWLKELVIKFIRLRATHQSRAQMKAHLQGFQFFSKSLFDSSPLREPSDLCRNDVLKFIEAMTQAKLKTQSKRMYLGSIKQLFETCVLEGWGNIQDKVFVYSTDYPRKLEHLPKAIPEKTMADVDHMISKMPVQLARQIVVLRDTGMRTSEMLSLPLDCLVYDSSKIIGLKYMMWKLKKEHQIPVSQAVIDSVINQKSDLILEAKKRGKPLPKYLFPAPDGDRYHSGTFRLNLLRYVKKYNIRDVNGELFNLHPHRFRHTLATRMINNGVQQHVVQKMLGHETPNMTAVYAKLSDKTLKVEFEKYQGRLIDIYGHVVDEATSTNSVDLKWLAKNVNAQALPNGYCGIPVIMSDCPTANSCLTCTHFRTDQKFLPQHEAQLAETNKILENAQTKGWIRQIETNTKVRLNLERIVTTLKTRPEEPAGE